MEERSECHDDDDDDDDPYLQEDLPEEFIMIKFSKWAVIHFFLHDCHCCYCFWLCYVGDWLRVGGYRHAVKNCLWLAFILIASRFVLVDRNENLVYGKALLVKVLASSFHVSTYFDRVQYALFDQYVIKTLSGPPLTGIHLEPVEEDQTMAEVHQFHNAGKLKRITQTRKSFPSFKNSRFSTVAIKEEKEGITIGHLHRLNQKNISAWNMKRLMNIVRKGTLSTLDEQRGEDETAVQIRSDVQAKVAAKKIFYNVAKPRSK
ncbi:hypothetical protein AgCh_013614 [Apium graveolens]